MENKFININPFSRSGKKLTAVKKIVCHYTANPGATAHNHYRYFNTLKDRYASSHIFVDKIESLCIIPLDEVAYHANDRSYRGVEELKPNANLLSIGVELCQEKDGSFHPETLKKAAIDVAYLCEKFNLDPNKDIVRHYDVTKKNCPAPWVKNPKEFTVFKGYVKAFIGGEKKLEADSADGKLTRGERGPNVKILNGMLKTLGHTTKTDDLFDQYTEAALIYFQKAHGLTPDGVYTTAVGKVMKEEIEKKDKEKGAVYRVQIGAFQDSANAEKLAAQLKIKGFSAIIVQD